MSLALESRIALERKIVRMVLREALKAGYEIGIDNGGDDKECRSTDYGTLDKAIMATDDERLYLYNGQNCDGWVLFVYGNDGWDVISDYTTSLEGLLKPVFDMITKLGY